MLRLFFFHKRFSFSLEMCLRLPTGWDTFLGVVSEVSPNVYPGKCDVFDHLPQFEIYHGRPSWDISGTSRNHHIFNFHLVPSLENDAMADMCGMVGKVYAQATPTYELGQLGARSWACGAKRGKNHPKMRFF